jgi:glycolate oxidase iron-sulfur subunit
MAVTEPEIKTQHHVTVAESPGLQGFLSERDYEALVKCVHCGLCLNECPTYRANGLEPDSPRGRLYLIRAVSEGTLDVTDDVVDHLQKCLVCRACETACPSNVQFGQVMEAARHELLEHYSTPKRRFFSWLAFRQLFPYPSRLKAVGLLLRLYQRSPLPIITDLLARARLLPARLAVMEKMAPRLSDRFLEALHRGHDLGLHHAAGVCGDERRDGTGAYRQRLRRHPAAGAALLRRAGGALRRRGRDG